MRKTIEDHQPCRSDDTHFATLYCNKAGVSLWPYMILSLSCPFFPLCIVSNNFQAQNTKFFRTERNTGYSTMVRRVRLQFTLTVLYPFTVDSLGASLECAGQNTLGQVV